MTYEEARNFINDSNQYGSKLGLDLVTELMNRLGNPQDRIKIIHVAGTNGKGSTTAFIASILATQGYKTGRYISPAVFEYEERIQISRADVPGDAIHTAYITHEGIASCISRIQQCCSAMVADGFDHPTSFEIETAMAFLYLADEKVDYAVIEVGLGGRLDATNVINRPECCVITSISKDHMQYLGDTLALIASEKVGIIKEGVPVVTGNTSQEVLEVLQSACVSKGCKLNVVDESEAENRSFSPEGTQFSYHSNEYGIKLLGEHQISNALLAIEAVELLRESGAVITQEAIRNGLAQAIWRGRLEIIHRAPYVIIDGAHNEDAAIQLRRALKLYFSGWLARSDKSEYDRRLIYIMGVLADKEYPAILDRTAGLADVIITLTPNNVRGLSSQILAQEAAAYCTGRIIDAGTVEEAVRLAYLEAGPEDVILAFGSLSYLGELAKLTRGL